MRCNQHGEGVTRGSAAFTSGVPATALFVTFPAEWRWGICATRCILFRGLFLRDAPAPATTAHPAHSSGPLSPQRPCPVRPQRVPAYGYYKNRWGARGWERACGWRPASDFPLPPVVAHAAVAVYCTQSRDAHDEWEILNSAQMKLFTWERSAFAPASVYKPSMPSPNL